MTEGIFHLHGVTRLMHTIQLNGRDEAFCIKTGETFRARYILRVMMPLHTILITIEAVVTQTLRGLIFIITGIITFDSKRIVFGIMDELSVLIQIVVLPALGIVAIFSPSCAGRKLETLYHTLNDDTTEGGSLDFTCQNFRVNSQGNKVTRVVARFLESIVTLPIAQVHGISYTATSLASGEGKSALMYFIGLNLVSLLSPIFAVIHALSEKNEDDFQAIIMHINYVDVAKLAAYKDFLTSGFEIDSSTV